MSILTDRIAEAIDHEYRTRIPWNKQRASQTVVAVVREALLSDELTRSIDMTLSEREVILDALDAVTGARAMRHARAEVILRRLPNGYWESRTLVEIDERQYPFGAGNHHDASEALEAVRIQVGGFLDAAVSGEDQG